MEKLLAIWFSNQQVKGNNVTSTVIRKKAKMILDSSKASLHWCLFAWKMNLMLMFLTTIE
jgi:hypothetical protein